ncbi:hypothetical protein [Celerinatantimonas sp. MCCC 1A17872]
MSKIALWAEIFADLDTVKGHILDSVHWIESQFEPDETGNKS